MKYKIWDKEETLITPIGEVLTPAQVVKRYPNAGIEGTKFIISDSPVQLQCWDEFEPLIMFYKKLGAGITDTMSDQEALDAMTYFQDNPPVFEATAEDRVAAAMEFANILQLPDVLTKTKASEASLRIIKRNVDQGLWTDQMIDIVSVKGMVDATQKTALKTKVTLISKS